MSRYRVKLGEEILDVDGLPGLVALAVAGRLGPEDPVFIPATNRWHYARSVRQLREYFPGVPASSPAMPIEARQEPEPHSEESDGGDAKVLTLRRGRWTADGKGIEVPVFSYEIDADPPLPLRLIVLTAGGTLFALATWLYLFGYSAYVQRRAATETPSTSRSVLPAHSPIPTPPLRATATPDAPAAVASDAPAQPASAPNPLPAFDGIAVHTRVATEPLTPVTRPDQFGNAMRADLTRLAIPIREIALVATKGTRDSAVPFALRIDYVPGDKSDAVATAKARYAIVVMAGRRIAQLHLSVKSFHLRTLAGKNVASDVEIPLDLAGRAWSGTAQADEVSALFAGK